MMNYKLQFMCKIWFKVVGKRLGILSIKSSPGVYFYVARNKMEDDDKPKTIHFNKQLLNIGNAMDMSTGVFTVPTPGIYQFSFSMTKDGLAIGELYVYLRLNSKNIGLAISNSGFYAGLASFQSILSLKKGDRIDLHKYKGKINDESFNACHFTGMMLEENMTDKI